MKLSQTKESPQCFNSQGDGSEDPLTWNTMYSRIAVMPHLHQLRCSLGATEALPTHMLREKQFNEGREKEFLEHLQQISSPDRFAVVLMWEQLLNSVTKNENFSFINFWER